MRVRGSRFEGAPRPGLAEYPASAGNHSDEQTSLTQKKCNVPVSPRRLQTETMALVVCWSLGRTASAPCTAEFGHSGDRQGWGLERRISRAEREREKEKRVRVVAGLRCRRNEAVLSMLHGGLLDRLT